MVRSGTTNTCFLHRVTIFSTCIFLLQKRYQSHNNLFSPVQDLFNLKIVAFSANKPKQTKCSIKRKKALEYQGLFCFTVFSYCKYGGATRNRTGDKGFADPCLTAWPWRLSCKCGCDVIRTRIDLERITGLEPATFALARRRSTK